MICQFSHYQSELFWLEIILPSSGDDLCNINKKTLAKEGLACTYKQLCFSFTNTLYNHFLISKRSMIWAKEGFASKQIPCFHPPMHPDVSAWTLLDKFSLKTWPFLFEFWLLWIEVSLFWLFLTYFIGKALFVFTWVILAVLKYIQPKNN